MVVLIGFLLLLNLVISIWNSYAAGITLAEARVLRGFPLLLNWSARVMSICGFTYVFAILLTMFLSSIGQIDAETAEGVFSMTYIAVIVPVVGFGLVITIHSWKVAYETRHPIAIGLAGWNTFATAYNTVRAFTMVPKAYSSIIKLGSGKTKVVIFLVATAAFLAIICSNSIVAYAARNHADFKLKEKPKRSLA